MSDWQKIAIGIASALAVGLVAGYLIGSSGKGALEKSAAKAYRAAKVAKEAAKKARAEVEKSRGASARKVELLRCKEDLLRGLMQVHANNFGVASQHLGSASARLKQVRATADAASEKRVDAILKEMSQAHTLAMKLDRMVGVRIERLVELVHELPGAR